VREGKSLVRAKGFRWSRFAFLGNDGTEREFFIDNLLVRIYLIFEMVLVSMI